MAAWPNAVCNDGSPAAYRVRLGYGAARNRWLIYLEGGGWCTTAEDCGRRPPELVSSRPYEIDPSRAVVGSTGILSSDPARNPDLYDATVVRVFYCSSDLWTGSRGGSGSFSESALEGWNFRGRDIVRAVLAELRDNYGLNEAREVIFFGGSAGAAGVALNLNEVRAQFAANVRFMGLMDAGFSLNEVAYDPSTNAPQDPPIYPNEEGLARALPLWNAQMDPYCVDQAAGLGKPLACLSPSTLLTYNLLKSPVFVFQALADMNFLGALGVPADPVLKTPIPEASAYVANYRTEMRAALSQVSSYHTVFAVDGYMHGIMKSGDFSSTPYSFSNGSKTVVQAVSEFLKNPCGGNKSIQ